MSDNGQSALESALIGCFGGLFATFCVYPLDLAKSKVSAHIKRKDDKGPDVSSIEVLKKIMATKGAAGLYEGMGGRALQCFVEDFVFFWCVFSCLWDKSWNGCDMELPEMEYILVIAGQRKREFSGIHHLP